MSRAQRIAVEFGKSSLIPKYDGTRTVNAVNQFIGKLEDTLQECNLTDGERIYVATSLFQETAYTWWSSVKLQTVMDLDAIPTTWTAFCDVFRTTFKPTKDIDHARSELRRLKIGNKTIDEYVA